MVTEVWEMDKEKKSNYKKWLLVTISMIMVVFVLLCSLVVYVDPFLHYHGPDRFSYEFLQTNQRYLNDGIVRHYTYDTIITGTSMTENFKTSECDEIFGGTSVKVPFSAGRYQEIDRNLKRAFQSGNTIQRVIRCLDYHFLIMDKDEELPNYQFPTYLTNDFLLDDIKYVLNKDVLMQVYSVLKYTNKGAKTTTFDEYSNWTEFVTFGKEAVLSTYSLEGEPCQQWDFVSYTKEDEKTVLLNIRQNVTELIGQHPEAEFLLFFPPYSIAYWDQLNFEGKIAWRIEAEKTAIEELLKYPNIRLYSFCTMYDLVCDLDRYWDVFHYDEEISSEILSWMYQDEHRLTTDNYLEYLNDITEFYSSYDYLGLHE